ncbi:hypothetical protein RSAG8_13925, partial [Rhizoctonia solani AG-8 WAC10335]
SCISNPASARGNSRFLQGSVCVRPDATMKAKVQDHRSVGQVGVQALAGRCDHHLV